MRFGAMQEGRETQRREKTVDIETTDHPPASCAIPDSDDALDLSEASTSTAAPPQGSDHDASVHHSSHRHGSQETSLRGQKPGQDGQEQAREATLAQHASEQHGKRDLGKQDAERLHRSTRELMGRVGDVGGVAHKHGAEPHQAEGAHSPSHEPGQKGSSHSPTGGGSHAASGGEGKAHASGGGGGAHVHAHTHASARSTGSVAPTIGGDVIAAAVGSGVQGSPGLGSDQEDDEGQGADGSEEAAEDSHIHVRPVKLTRATGMECELGFDGDERGREHGDPSNPRQEFGSSSNRGQQREASNEPRTGTGAHGGGDHESPEGHAAAPEQEALDAAPTEPVAEAQDHAHAERFTETVVETTPSGQESSNASVVGMDAASTVVEALTKTRPPEDTTHSEPLPEPTDGPTRGLKAPSPDTLERTAILSPGLDLVSADEYFFFDDARLEDEAAS